MHMVLYKLIVKYPVDLDDEKARAFVSNALDAGLKALSSTVKINPDLFDQKLIEIEQVSLDIIEV